VQVAESLLQTVDDPRIDEELDVHDGDGHTVDEVGTDDVLLDMHRELVFELSEDLPLLRLLIAIDAPREVNLKDLVKVCVLVLEGWLGVLLLDLLD
jgi:hypothetical protein